MNSSDYIFRALRPDEVPQMFDLILRRMKWMDEHNIHQWNVTQYDEVYPLEYYEEHQRLGQAYVLEDSRTQEIVCAGILLEEDDRWDAPGSAIYVHNLASKVGCSGVGSLFLEHTETYALQKGKEYLRLDSCEGNEGLGRFYERHGFTPVGTCVEGIYRGTLREKALAPGQA